MSATNRGAVRNERDFYATPSDAFVPLLPFLACWPEQVWEPACGDRRLIKWGNEFFDGKESRPRIVWDGDDLNNGYDFLMDKTPRAAICTNPPFSLAFEFCKHARNLSTEVALLLRLNFLASAKRRDWWRANEPRAIFVLSERPSFTGNGKTDATDYAWFFWSNKVLRGIKHL